MVESKTTSDACLKGAWDALLKGDTAERDRLCERAKMLMEAEKMANAIEKVMSIDFYVKPNGVAISSKIMAKAAGVCQ
jgi:hypothetical protein